MAQGTRPLFAERTVCNECKMNVAIFLDTAPCGLYVDLRFGGPYHLHLQGLKSAEADSA
jgi:hypothetical protein